MNGQADTQVKPLSAVYVVLMLLLIFVSLVTYLALPWVIAIALNWSDDWKQMVRTAAPRVDECVLSNGKLYVPLINVNFLDPAGSDVSLSMVDLDSKAVTEIPGKFKMRQVHLVADGPVVWSVSNTSVVRIEDGVATTFPAGITLQTPETAFLHHGQLMVVNRVARRSKLGFEFQLLSWSGTKWEPRGELLLPGITSAGNAIPSSVYEDAADHSDQENEFQFNGASLVRALEVRGTLHWFCSDGTRTLHTTQDVIISPESVSAIAPENTDPPHSGWTLLGDVSQIQLGSDAKGILALTPETAGAGQPKSKLMRLTDGKWVEQETIGRYGLLDSRMVSDGARAYLVSLVISNEIKIRDLTDPGSQSSHFPAVTGKSLETLQRSVQTHSWWTPYTVIILFSLAASRLMSVYRTSHYEFGNRTVELASITRRALAKIIDGLVISLPVIALELAWTGELDASEAVIEIFSSRFADQDQFRVLRYMLLGFAAYGLTCLVVAGILEGLWGISPGKWLLGIRVVRSTLRPCGFLRATLRELLLFVDAFVCCGWLPGACSVAFSDFRQRIGDFVADSLVIRARELPVK